MNRLFLSAMAVATLGAVSTLAASAADIPAPVYKAAPVAVFSWTGCYVGGHGGGMWGKKDWYFTGVYDGSNEPNGWLGGFQAGCNYQTGQFVFGVQGDWAWADADATNAADPAGTLAGLDLRSKISSLASVTGRIGYAFNNALLYVKGGGAWVRDRYDIMLAGVSIVNGKETRGGWTAGVGGEYAFAPGWSLFAEYNYYDFGTRTVSFYNSATGAFATTEDIKQRISTAKVGVNWRFGAR